VGGREGAGPRIDQDRVGGEGEEAAVRRRAAVTREIDVLVVGAGPAGLATAILARAEGLTVTVVDGAPGPPVDKACGEGLMPDGVEALRRLGVDPSAIEARSFHGIRYVDGETVAEGSFPGEPGLGVRRTRLHAALAERAVDAGVEVRWGTKVARWPPPLPARFLVGADGLLSRVRRWAGLEGRAARRRRFGVRRHFHVPAAEVPRVVEVWWGDRCEAYVTPVRAEEVGVAMLWDGRTADFDALLAGFPRLAARLAGREVLSRDRGAGPLRQRVRGVVRSNLALVGDASGYVDAITGEGLSLAFHQAAALARCLAAGDLAPYAAAHRRLGRLPNGTTRILLALERRPILRRRAVRALAADPALFSRLLAVHAREAPLASLGWSGAARLVLRLARS